MPSHLTPLTSPTHPLAPPFRRADKAGLEADVDFALAQLGVPCIDIIVLCRMPRDVPIEESVAAMAGIVAAGKAKHIGLSEASAAFIRRAHAVHPIFAIEQEWSLWARDIEAEIVPACRELGVKIVAYSPLGRGFLTGTLRSRGDAAFGEKGDWRLVGQPRFAEGALEAHLKLVDEAAARVAARRGVTVGQLALAWLHAKGEDVIPIPGTSSIAHLDQNVDAAGIALSAAEVAELDALVPPEAVVGDRYPHQHNQFQQNA